MEEINVYAEFLHKLNIIRFDILCNSFKNNLGYLEFQVTKPNLLRIIYNSKEIHSLIFSDLELETESISNFTKSDKKISFNLKSSCLNREIFNPICNCSKNLSKKLKISNSICCSFCFSELATTKQITQIKSEISKNNQLEEIFYCHGKDEKLTEISVDCTECVIHGLEFSINKILLNNDNIFVDKKILTCFRCHKVVGRLDSMAGNQLKLYSSELLACLPKYDVDGDIVDEESVNLCSSEVEISHLFLNEISNDEATRILLIAITESKLTNVALLWNLNQTFSVYREKIDISQRESNQVVNKEHHYRLLCLPNTSDRFQEQLEIWNRDMRVYHILAPQSVCQTFVNSLLLSRIDGSLSDGFIPCSIRLDGC